MTYQIPIQCLNCSS